MQTRASQSRIFRSNRRNVSNSARRAALHRLKNAWDDRILRLALILGAVVVGVTWAAVRPPTVIVLEGRKCKEWRELYAICPLPRPPLPEFPQK